MLSLALITVALIAITRWVYHLPEDHTPRPPRPNTRKEPKP